MYLANLALQHVRNLRNDSLHLHPRANLITGQNASGKTSLLEAIYFLARARSFRTSQWQAMLTHDQEELSVVGGLQDDSGRMLHIGIQKGAKLQQIRVGGESVRSLSELAANLPLQLITPESHQLLAAGPRNRRRFLDWGVFHVEHNFYKDWLRYQRALKQRNAALKQRASQGDVEAWTPELVQAAEQLDRYRQGYINHLAQVIPRFVSALLGEKCVEIRYHAGWSSDRPLQSILLQNLTGDRAAGFTRQGPHRAEIQVLLDGRPAHQVVSRGQQKLLVSVLLMAQAEVYSQINERPCVVLIDDLAAELDGEHRARFLALLQQMNVQLFITTIEADESFRGLLNNGKKFHVEQGQVREIH